MPQPRPGRRRGVVIAWMPVSQRSATIAERLGYDLILVGRAGFRRAWTAPLAYPLSAARTVVELVRRRPRAAIVAAPPFLAAIVVLPFMVALRGRLAIDIHTGALLDRRWRWSVPILAWASRAAVAAVVTLPSLRSPLEQRGVTTLVIPDPLPRLEPTDEVRSRPDSIGADESDRGVPLIVAICGWGLDEPIETLVEAARDRPWRLVVTGRPRRELPTPPNVELAGFLPSTEYVDLVARADAVIVLTERDETLLSGAWEAIALGRPLVLSGTPALRSTFGPDVVYVEPEPASIAAGIDTVLADPTATARIAQLRERFGHDNDAALADLRDRLEIGDGRP